MRIVIVDTYYASFLASHYRAQLQWSSESYARQLQALLDRCFGTSDFYSRHLNSLGCEAIDIIANCVPLQSAWGREHRIKFSELALHLPPRFFRIPVLGRWLASLPGLLDIALTQIKAFKPDVVY